MKPADLKLFRYVVDQSAKLASSASVETLADEVVQKQSKEFIELILDDPSIKKKTAEAVWGVIGNMFYPTFLGWFVPSFRKRAIAEPTPKEENCQRNSESDASPSPSDIPLNVPASIASPKSSAVNSKIPDPSLNTSARVEQRSTPFVADSIPAAGENPSGATVFREANIAPIAQIPAVPPQYALLVPPSSVDEGDNSLTDDDRRRASDGERRF